MNYKGGVRNRRSRALSRLQEQLKSGVKPIINKDAPEAGMYITIPLEEKDVKRIKREIEVLKSKI